MHRPWNRLLALNFTGCWSQLKVAYDSSVIRSSGTPFRGHTPVRQAGWPRQPEEERENLLIIFYRWREISNKCNDYNAYFVWYKKLKYCLAIFPNVNGTSFIKCNTKKPSKVITFFVVGVSLTIWGSSNFKKADSSVLWLNLKAHIIRMWTQCI